MVVGNPSVFAIESSITQPYERPSQRALGFFVLHVDGKSYGVRAPDATLLACSFDAVARRIAQRGKHNLSIGSESDAAEVAEAVCAAMYDENRQEERFFGMSAGALREALASNEILWAPDGDAAFDDGGHVLQFDHGAKVHLIAFENIGRQEDFSRALANVWIDADDFYAILEEWKNRFEAEWTAALKLKIKPLNRPVF